MWIKVIDDWIQQRDKCLFSVITIFFWHGIIKQFRKGKDTFNDLNRRQRRTVMVYITGDVHGEFERFFDSDSLLNQMRLFKEDFVIVCGDLGLCWARNDAFVADCEKFSRMPYTILWVQGNHENYDMITEFPVEEWHGGKVRHIVRNKVILLERGQVFTIDGKRFFTFGGATSHDIQGGILERDDPSYEEIKREAITAGLPFRILHESWWPEELPSKEEMEEGMLNLQKVGNKVDYIITHCASTSVQDRINEKPWKKYEPDVLTDYFQTIEQTVEFEHWYFGHYHMDEKLDEKYTVLYYGVIPLGGVQDTSIRKSKLGVPGFIRGERVSFYWKEMKKTGKVEVVDAYGTFEQNEEPSYDVYVKEDNCLYKHLRESLLQKEI